MREKTPAAKINVAQEIRTLTPLWIIDNTTLSTKAIQFLNQVDTLQKAPVKIKKQVPQQVIGSNFKERVAFYRICFPQIKLPSGKYARGSEVELEKKFINFFSLFPQYPWETVIAATERYVTEYVSKDYLYMRTSSHFISKQLQDKTMIYDLATYCDMVENNIQEVTPEEYYLRPIR